MSLLIDVTIRSSVIVGAALVASAVLRRRSAALRHAVLAGAMLMSVLVVPLSWTMPEWRVPVPVFLTPSHRAVGQIAVAGVTRAGAGPTVSDSSGAATLKALAISLWEIGVLLSLARLGVALFRLRRIASRAAPLAEGTWSHLAEDISADLHMRQPIVLLESRVNDLLATWGMRRPRILLPAGAGEWKAARIHAVLCHEMAHIRRRDWLMQLVAEILAAVQWFNPLYAIACRRLRQLSEHACDDSVLRRGVRPREYAQHLLDIAGICRPSSMPVAAAVPMARRSTLERRIAAMLNTHADRQPVSARALAMTFVCLVAMAIPTAALRAAQASPRPLSGSIYDTTGALLPDAALTLEDAQQHVWHATSDSDGHFALEAVAPGHYVLTVTKPGFQTLKEETDLRASRDWDRAITMQVGDLQESVTIEQARGRVSAPTAAPVRLRVGGNVRPPKKVHNEPAVYPASMIAAGVEGKVQLEATIGEDGSVHSVRVLTAQVHPDLARSAADAVRQWKFEPTLLNGKPVEVVIKVAVDFRLKD